MPTSQHKEGGPSRSQNAEFGETCPGCQASCQPSTGSCTHVNNRGQGKSHQKEAGRRTPRAHTGRAKAVSPAPTVEKLIHGGHRTELSKSPASTARANEAQHARVKKASFRKTKWPQRSLIIHVRNPPVFKATQKKGETKKLQRSATCDTQPQTSRREEKARSVTGGDISLEKQPHKHRG